MKAVIVQTTCGSKKEAREIAKILVSEKLAACVQIQKVESIYTWNDKLCLDKERLLFIKTRKDNFKKVKRKIKENHSYDLPEIIEIKITKASKKYLQFIGESC